MKMNTTLLLPVLALALTGCTTSELTGWEGASRRERVVWGGAHSLLPRIHDFSLVWTSERGTDCPTELPREVYVEFFGRIPAVAGEWRKFWNVDVDAETPHRFGLLRESDGVTLYVDGQAGQKVCACAAHDMARLDDLARAVGTFTYRRVFAIDDDAYTCDLN